MSANRLLGFTVQRYEKKCICAKKVYFYCHRLHFFTVASRIKVPSKVLQNLRMCKFLVEKVLGVLKVLRVIEWFYLKDGTMHLLFSEKCKV